MNAKDRRILCNILTSMADLIVMQGNILSKYIDPNNPVRQKLISSGEYAVYTKLTKGIESDLAELRHWPPSKDRGE